jgi:uncharacterized membrane protein (TIGR02234 family)
VNGLSAKREYTLALLTAAVGAGLILLAARAQWAEAVYVPPKPLSPQVVGVSGNDLVPVASALALATLAGLAAVIATRGVLRRVAGALLAIFGAAAGAAVLTTVSAATVLSVAAGQVASPGSAAVSGAAGSTTSGTSSGGPLVIAGATGHAIMTGTGWHVAVLAGALLIFLAGLATMLRGPDWPVMSSKYDAPEGGGAGRRDSAGAARALDSATMWESLNGGDDPTDDAPVDDVPIGESGRGGSPRGSNR